MMQSHDIISVSGTMTKASEGSLATGGGEGEVEGGRDEWRCRGKADALLKVNHH